MTNNPTIDGVSPAKTCCGSCPAGCVIHAVVPAKCVQCGSTSADICNQNGCGFLESGNGAPAVERQEPDEAVVEFGFETRSTNVSQEAYSIFIARESALQSTIAQLQARVADLESGRGEVITWRYCDPSGESPWFNGRPDEVNIQFVSSRNGVIEYGYSAPPAPVAPEGWKLVPIEPTELMIRRGNQNYSWSVAKIYKAMIEDAPVYLDATVALNEVRK